MLITDKVTLFETSIEDFVEESRESALTGFKNSDDLHEHTDKMLSMMVDKSVHIIMLTFKSLKINKDTLMITLKKFDVEEAVALELLGKLPTKKKSNSLSNKTTIYQVKYLIMAGDSDLFTFSDGRPSIDIYGILDNENLGMVFFFCGNPEDHAAEIKAKRDALLDAILENVKHMQRYIKREKDILKKECIALLKEKRESDKLLHEQQSLF